MKPWPFFKPLLPHIVLICCIKLVAFFPNCIDRFYTFGIYPYIAQANRWWTSFFPFSIGDVLYVFFILYLVYKTLKKRKELFLKKAYFLMQFSKIILSVYIVFQLLWGLNYYKNKIDLKINISKEYDYNKLLKFTQKIQKITNGIHFEITKNKAEKVVVSESNKALFLQAASAYKSMPKGLEFIAYAQPSVKESLLSKPLSYMGFGGYMNPFTGEAQVNTCKPLYTLPMTTCHEIAHQTGIGSEAECNFVGFVVASKSDNLYFKYSAYTFLLRYCFYHLEAYEKGSSAVFRKQVHPGIIKNFEESEVFWEQHHTFIDTFFEWFYDGFLKLNQQTDGMQGYSKFMGLLINYDEKYGFINGN